MMKKKANDIFKISSIELKWKLYFKLRKHEIATHRYCSIIQRRGWCQYKNLRIISTHYFIFSGKIGKKHL